jgi:SAM-dependent methyltransferase
MAPHETNTHPGPDSERIHQSSRRRYAAVAENPTGQFPYPVGRASAERLGYPRDLLDRIPAEVVARFVGVGNPFSLGEPEPGRAVLDIGCGAGFDCHVAARCVGPMGRVCGVDLSEEMLSVALAGQARCSAANIEFRKGYAEALPVPSGWADLVISNGVLNLAACKATAFGEVFRVLKPGGRFQAVDLVLVAELPPHLRDDEFAWSN